MEEIIEKIVKTQNNKERIDIFKNNIENLKDWTIVIFNDNKKKNVFPDYLKTKKISTNFFNYSPYPVSDFLVFNTNSVMAFCRGEKYDHTISGAIELDTNILSYLYKKQK